MRADVEIRVYVESGDFGRDVQVAIVQEGEGVCSAAKVSDGGRLKFHADSVQHGQLIVPTLRLSRHMAEQLLAGLLALNVKSPSAGAIEGELKATKYHLEDLRKLLAVERA